jgi:hypothetical protein
LYGKYMGIIACSIYPCGKYDERGVWFWKHDSGQ